MSGEVLIEKSAGFRELDFSAAEAVKKWLFEPARRGKEAGAGMGAAAGEI